MPKNLAPSITPKLSGPLLDVASRIFKFAPWGFMSDLELIGMRDGEGRLYAATILGSLREVFAVLIYRGDAGLRWIHRMATTRQMPDPDLAIEELDYLKVEWCRKGELNKSDLKTLADAGFRPKGGGSVWPRFESATPGWCPWGLSDEEACVVKGLLEQVERFVHLRQIVGILHREPIEDRLPIIPAGEPLTLKVEEIEWLPFLPAPPPLPEPARLSAQEQEKILKFPVQGQLIFELIAPLVPSLSFLDEQSGKPYMARVCMVVDRASTYMLAAHLENGVKPIKDAVSAGIVQSLLTAKVRPGRIHVADERLESVLRPLCQSIKVELRRLPLHSAPAALKEFSKYVAGQKSAPR